MASERPEPEVRGGRAQRWAWRSEGEGPAARRGRGLLRVWGPPGSVHDQPNDKCLINYVISA